MCCSPSKRSSTELPSQRSIIMTTDSMAPDADGEFAEHQDVEFAPRLVGVIAEFGTTDQLFHASEVVRDGGYTRWDTHTPFPLHFIDVAMGVKPTILPWIVLCGGLTGATTGLAMQFYLNGWERAAEILTWPFAGYPYLISGKPLFSLPANIPITFELTILFSAFSAFFGMIILNRLIKLYNPLFQSDRFRAVTDDKFFLSIDARDPKFNDAHVRSLLSGLGATAVDEVWDKESRKIPGVFATIGLVLFSLALIPPVLVLKSRHVTTTEERIHPVQDMDFQAKYKPQQRNPFFADQRAMRPQVPGTVARGQFFSNESQYLFGVEPAVAQASIQDPVNNSFDQRDAASRSGANSNGEGGNSPAAPPAAGMDPNQNWVASIPVPVTEELMARGKQRFEIYCAPCHGLAGMGGGLVDKRAQSLKQSTWLPVPSLLEVTTRNRADGFIYRAITEGVRKMPAYGSQIRPEDRWAIVLYVRALQKTQSPPVPEPKK